MSELASTETPEQKKKRKLRVGILYWSIALFAMFFKFLWNGFHMAFKELMGWIIAVLMGAGLLDED